MWMFTIFIKLFLKKSQHLITCSDKNSTQPAGGSITSGNKTLPTRYCCGLYCWLMLICWLHSVLTTCGNQRNESVNVLEDGPLVSQRFAEKSLRGNVQHCLFDCISLIKSFDPPHSDVQSVKAHSHTWAELHFRKLYFKSLWKHNKHLHWTLNSKLDFSEKQTNTAPDDHLGSLLLEP